MAQKPKKTMSKGVSRGMVTRGSGRAIQATSEGRAMNKRMQDALFMSSPSERPGYPAQYGNLNLRGTPTQRARNAARNAEFAGYGNPNRSMFKRRGK